MEKGKKVKKYLREVKEKNPMLIALFGLRCVYWAGRLTTKETLSIGSEVTPKEREKERGRKDMQGGPLNLPNSFYRRIKKTHPGLGLTGEDLGSREKKVFNL